MLPIKKKTTPKPRQVYEVAVEINGEMVFEKAVSVRRHSELNGIVNNFDIEVGDKVVITATRAV